MTHHPHLHMIVPSGGISLDNTHWVPCRPGFLLPVRVPLPPVPAIASTRMGTSGRSRLLQTRSDASQTTISASRTASS